MARVVAEIARRKQPVTHLPLHAQVPLLQRRRIQIERRVDIDAKRGERLVLPVVVQRGERIAAGISEVRIGETAGRIRNRDLRAPRRIVRETRVEEQLRRIVEDAPRRAHAHVLVAGRIPRDADARSEVGDLPFCDAVVRIAVIAREDQTGGRLRIDLAVDVLVEERLLEVAHPSERVLHRVERFPPQAEVQRDVRAQAPRVLRVDAEVVVVVVVVDGIALQVPAADDAEHEVGERQAGALPVERELTVRRTVVERCDIRMDPVRAHRQLVRAADEVEVIGNLIGLGIEVAGVRGAGADAEAVPVDADAHVAGHEAEDLAAEIRSAEKGRQRTIVQGAIESDVQ